MIVLTICMFCVGVVFIIIIKNRLQKKEKVSFYYNYNYKQEEEIERKPKTFIYILPSIVTVLVPLLSM